MITTVTSSTPKLAPALPTMGEGRAPALATEPDALCIALKSAGGTNAWSIASVSPVCTTAVRGICVVCPDAHVIFRVAETLVPSNDTCRSVAEFLAPSNDTCRLRCRLTDRRRARSSSLVGGRAGIATCSASCVGVSSQEAPAHAIDLVALAGSVSSLSRTLAPQGTSAHSSLDGCCPGPATVSGPCGGVDTQGICTELASSVSPSCRPASAARDAPCDPDLCAFHFLRCRGGDVVRPRSVG